MNRTAIGAVVASLSLIALSAAPANAAPPERFEVPEECSVLFGNTVCTSSSGWLHQTETPSGVVTVVGEATFNSAIYEGANGTSGAVLNRDHSVEHFNFTGTSDETKVFHQTIILDTENRGITCDVVIQYVIAAGEQRHFHQKVNCS